MKAYYKLVSFEEASAIVSSSIKPIETTEVVSLDNALGRVAACDIRARRNTPAFDRAGVDGYALKAADVEGAGAASPVRLELAGRLYAGDSTAQKLASGQCDYVATGARMPKGADCVVMVEDTETAGKEVLIKKPVPEGANIGRKGEDITRGELIVGRGARIDPGRIGTIASQGLRRAEVFRKPRIAVMPTGEELARVGKRLKPGQLYDINSHTLAALIRENGGEPVALPLVGDTLEEIKASLTHALEYEAVVISGGSSMGEKDLIIDVLEEWGKVFFHGLSIKPGKPTTFALVNGKPVFGLPGYPTSCLLSAYLFLAPAVRQMARLPERYNPPLTVTLGASVAGTEDRRRFQTVRLENGRAFPLNKESGAITGMAFADGYVAVPEGTEMMPKGKKIAMKFF